MFSICRLVEGSGGDGTNQWWKYRGSLEKSVMIVAGTQQVHLYESKV